MRASHRLSRPLRPFKALHCVITTLAPFLLLSSTFVAAQPALATYFNQGCNGAPVSVSCSRRVTLICIVCRGLRFSVSILLYLLLRHPSCTHLYAQRPELTHARSTLLELCVATTERLTMTLTCGVFYFRRKYRSIRDCIPLR